MKIIELLNKIANGEEVPEKIKVGNKIYNYETFNIGKGDNYFTAEWGEVKGYRTIYDGTYYYLEIRDYNLNDEVEILEEEPRDINVCGSWLTKSEYDEYLKGEEEKEIPEKLQEFDIQGLEVSGYSMTQAEYLLEDGVKENREMINWILDYLKSKGE